MASAVALAFFLPVFQKPTLCAAIRRRIPAELFVAKWRTLMEEPAEPDAAPDRGAM